MSLAKLRDQVRACLVGDFTDREKVLWAYLKVCGRGEGRTRLAEAFRWSEEETQEALNSLIGLGYIARKGGRYSARDFDLTIPDAPDGPRTPPALAERVDEAFQTYNSARIDAGVPPSLNTPKAMKKFEELIEWLVDQNVRFETFLAFAMGERTDFLRKKGVKFIPLETLTGDWLRQQFVEFEAPTRRPDTEAAGKRFVEVPGLREKLLAAGFVHAAGFNKATLRYIAQYAQNMILDPRSFPDPPEGYEEETEWVKKGMEAGRIEAA